MSDKTKLQWMNGSVIKQGDVASVFKLKLVILFHESRAVRLFLVLNF